MAATAFSTRRRPSPLRARRLLRGLRLRDVQFATDIPDVTISQIERGELPLRGRWLKRLSELYGTPSDVLLREMDRWASAEHAPLGAPGP